VWLVCESSIAMVGDVSIRELRAHTTEVLRRVQAGECLHVTVNGRPVAELVPLPGQATWVPRQHVLDALRQTDGQLHHELAEALPATIDQL
jgi:prevent-host-death family protein